MFGLGFLEKILHFKLFLSANEWMEGTGSDALEGTDDADTIDDKVTAYLQDPLNRLLANYRQGCKVEYASASTVTVSAGEVVCANSGDTILRMRKNTSSITVDITSDLDTGSEAVSATYYVYAVADADATTFTCKISTSSTGPTGVTYYKKLGSFYNDSSSDIVSDSISNLGLIKPSFGSWESKTTDTTYQATSDGLILAYTYGTGSGISIAILSDSSSPPTTYRSRISGGNISTAMYINAMSPVKKDDYYKVETTGTEAIYWIPLGV